MRLDEKLRRAHVGGPDMKRPAGEGGPHTRSTKGQITTGKVIFPESRPLVKPGRNSGDDAARPPARALKGA
jgi:hypothetical protein